MKGDQFRRVSKKEVCKLRSIASQLEPVYRIGKEGIKENSIRDLKNLLKKYGMVKVKIERGAMTEKGRGEIAFEVAEMTGSKVLEIRGFTFTLAIDDPKYLRKILKGELSPPGESRSQISKNLKMAF